MADEMKKAELLASEKINSELLSSEKRYQAEKKRLKEEEAESERKIREREYLERLATAKNNLAADKAARNERLRLQKEENEAYLTALKEAADKEREIYDQLKSDIKETYSDILSYAESSVGEVEKKRADMEEKLSEYGNLTKKVIFSGAGANGEDEIYTELTDLSETTAVLTKYADILSEIRKRMESGGFDNSTVNSLISMIGGLSVDKGLAFAGALSGKSDKEFSEYINAWQNKENAAKSLSAQIYRGEMQAAAANTVAYMTEELEKMGLEVPEGFFLSGSISAERFGDGFVSELAGQMSKIQSMIDSFNISLNLEMGSLSGNGATTTSVYSPTYQVNSSGSAAETLSAIKAAETRKILSGIV